MITNCIKHTFKDPSSQNEINISLKENNDSTILIIANNGVFLSAVNNHTSSLGLALIANLAGKENLPIESENGVSVRVKIKKGS